MGSKYSICIIEFVELIFQICSMIRLAIVDDKLVNRKTVRTNIASCKEMEVVLEAGNGEEFMDKMNLLTADKLPQIVLMDIDMPVMNGIEAIAVGSTKYPHTRFLVLTVFDDDEKIFEAIQAGASGYLLKDDSAVQLTEAITQALEYNAAPMSPAIARKTLAWLRQLPKPASSGQTETKEILSEREIEILKLMVEGLDYKKIADKLLISPFTVRTHTTKIYEKLHVNSKAQAIQMAYKYKWV
jgi:DNA-binding NarL/FixJ family response regulator